VGRRRRGEARSRTSLIASHWQKGQISTKLGTYDVTLEVPDGALREAYEKWREQGSRSATQKVLRADEAFEQGPDARLHWFYERTPFFDERALL
jgi:hypothetical protein